MRFLGGKPFIALLLVFALSNLFVFAGGRTFPSNEGVNLSGSEMLLGKLTTRSNKQILLNGSEAITGATILSGAQLVTPAGVTATVSVPNLGTVNIAPSSNVNLAFDKSTVKVNVSSGDATLSTVTGVSGFVVAADGSSTPSASGVPAPRPAGGIAGIGAAATVGLVAGGLGLIIAIIALHRANQARDCGRLVGLSPARACTNL
jgi:hypothetical protein